MDKIKLPIKHQKVEILIISDLMANDPSTKTDKKELLIVKDLAKKVKEISQEQENLEKIKLWKDHNSLIKTRPLVLCFPENAYEEMIPYSLLKTTDPFLREYEWYLRSLIYHWEELHDDFVITSRVKVAAVFNITDWGIPEVWENPESLEGAARFKQQIINEEDIERMKFPELLFDKDATDRNFEYVSEIFGNILDVKLYYTIIPMFFDLGMMGFFSRLRGLDQILFDMIDRPKWVHRVMDFLSKGMLNLIKDTENRGLLGLNNADDYIGSGGLGYTYDLPQKDFKGKVRLKDLWGFSESQELTGVSPEMIDEFVLPYQIRLLENYGLNYYGCCEDLSKKYNIAKKIPNLRRVSVAPWTNMQIAAEELQDKYVYVWKPNPADLAMDYFDEDFIRKKIKNGFELTKDCIIEIIMKDTHTLRNDPSRMKKWAKIAKEQAMNFY